MATLYLIWKRGCLMTSRYPEKPREFVPITPSRLSTIVCIENDVVLRYKGYDYKMVHPVTMGYDRDYSHSRFPFPSASSFVSVRFDPVPPFTKKIVPFSVVISAEDTSDTENPVSKIREVDFGSPESMFYQKQKGRVNIDDYLAVSDLIIRKIDQDVMPFKDRTDCSGISAIISPRYTVTFSTSCRDKLKTTIIDPNCTVIKEKFSTLEKALLKGNHAIKFIYNSWDFDPTKVHYIKDKRIIYVSGSTSHSNNKTFTNTCTLILSQGKDDSIELVIANRSFVTL